VLGSLSQHSLAGYGVSLKANGIAVMLLLRSSKHDARAIHVRRLLPALLALGALALAPGARGEERVTAHWRLAPAQAPPPPPGVAPAPYPVPIGEVGAISFWAPNRGLLVTRGTEESRGPVAAGVYAYDGVSWHQLSTVCGGEGGRIAWAGPDDFWTIAAQRAGQVLTLNGGGGAPALSLCHFEAGQVVGSYAMPLEQPDSYRQMYAAACYSPSDCWFAGATGEPPNAGAFHLHWNGSTVTAVYAPQDHSVVDMTLFDGQLYESAQIEAGDAFLPEEESPSNPPPELPPHPPVIHTISPEGGELCGEAESPFCNLVIVSKRTPLPVYGEGVSAAALQGFDLATDAEPAGTAATQLWAAANPVPNGDAPKGSKEAALTVLRLTADGWSQIVGAGAASPLRAYEKLAGASHIGDRGEGGTSDAIAPEPGSESAWLSLSGDFSAQGAEVDRLNADGTAEEPVLLPEASEANEGVGYVGYKGEAGPIACPAPEDCWMATNGGTNRATESQTVPGWLFHLTGGASVPPNTDPFFDGADGVISYRPPDSGVPVIPPDAPPADDSLSNQQPAPPPSAPPLVAPTSPPKAKRGRSLLEHVKSRFVKGRTLVIAFTLTARAHVQVLGRRRHRIVARTRRELLGPGRHRLSLTLNPARWPAKIDFDATPIGSSAPAGGSSTPSSSGNTIET
jgi:hypothetical protein